MDSLVNGGAVSVLHTFECYVLPLFPAIRAYFVMYQVQAVRH